MKAPGIVREQTATLSAFCFRAGLGVAAPFQQAALRRAGEGIAGMDAG
jgi:hypothetical protein